MTALVDLRHKLPPLKALTSLRFLATMYVVAFHIDLNPWVGNMPPLRNFVAAGHTGVTLFFVLSGYVLAYNYPHVRSAKEFWIARFARVYPVYFLSCFLCMMRPSTLRAAHGLMSITMGFLLLQAWWLPFSGDLNQNGWTLSVEVFFYFLFPLLLPMLSRLKGMSFLALQVLALAVSCAPLFLAAFHVAAPAGRLADFLVSRFPIVWLNTFIVGVYFGLRRQRAAKLVRPDGTRWTLPAAMTTCIVLLCTSVPALAQPLWMNLVVYAYAFLIHALARKDWTFLSCRVAQAAGEMSYGIYILQFPFAFAFYAVWFRLNPGRGGARTLLVVLLLVTAHASLRWVEMPARLWIRRLWTRRAVATMPV